MSVFKFEEAITTYYIYEVEADTQEEATRQFLHDLEWGEISTMDAVQEYTEYDDTKIVPLDQDGRPIKEVEEESK